jgi:hypothetical protein
MAAAAVARISRRRDVDWPGGRPTRDGGADKRQHPDERDCQGRTSSISPRRSWIRRGRRSGRLEVGRRPSCARSGAHARPGTSTTAPLYRSSPPARACERGRQGGQQHQTSPRARALGCWSQRRSRVPERRRLDPRLGAAGGQIVGRVACRRRDQAPRPKRHEHNSQDQHDPGALLLPVHPHGGSTVLDPPANTKVPPSTAQQVSDQQPRSAAVDPVNGGPGAVPVEVDHVVWLPAAGGRAVPCRGGEGRRAQPVQVEDLAGVVADPYQVAGHERNGTSPPPGRQITSSTRSRSTVRSGRASSRAGRGLPRTNARPPAAPAVCWSAGRAATPTGSRSPRQRR